jgi:hypothetical protein
MNTKPACMKDATEEHTKISKNCIIRAQKHAYNARAQKVDERAHEMQHTRERAHT